MTDRRVSAATSDAGRRISTATSQSPASPSTPPRMSIVADKGAPVAAPAVPRKTSRPGSGRIRLQPILDERKREWVDASARAIVHRLKETSSCRLRIFVSSAAGTEAEREYLSRRVFPELQQACERSGLTVTFLELRNGHENDYPVFGTHGLAARLSEVAAADAFVGIYAQRYGWQAGEGPHSGCFADNFEYAARRHPWLRSDESLAQKSAMELELIAREEVGRRTGFVAPAAFYFRDAAYDDVQLARARDLGREAESAFCAESAASKDRLDAMKARIRAGCAAGETKGPGQQAPLPNVASSATNGDQSTHTETRVSPGWIEGGYADPAEGAQKISETLRELLGAVAHLHGGGSFTGAGAPPVVDYEQRAHDSFVQLRAETFVGRALVLETLSAAADKAAQNGKLLVLTAPSGGGGSSLLAKWVLRQAETHRKRQLANAKYRYCVFYHFVGCSDPSLRPEGLLRRLALALAAAVGPGDQQDGSSAQPLSTAEYVAQFALTLSADTRQLSERVSDLLAEAKENQISVSIAIDGLGYLDAANNARELNWLPHQWCGANAIVSVSCESQSVLQALTLDRPHEVYEPTPMTRAEAIATCVAAVRHAVVEKHVGAPKQGAQANQNGGGEKQQSPVTAALEILRDKLEAVAPHGDGEGHRRGLPLTALCWHSVGLELVLSSTFGAITDSYVRGGTEQGASGEIMSIDDMVRRIFLSEDAPALFDRVFTRCEKELTAALTACGEYQPPRRPSASQTPSGPMSPSVQADESNPLAGKKLSLDVSLKRVVDRNVIAEVMICITLSRFGLTLNDLVGILEVDQSVLVHVLHSLRGFLVENTAGLFTFFHRELRFAAEQRYCHNKPVLERCAGKMAEYFEGLYKASGSTGVNSSRAEEELVWVLFRVRNYESLAKCLWDVGRLARLMSSDENLLVLCWRSTKRTAKEIAAEYMRLLQATVGKADGAPYAVVGRFLRSLGALEEAHQFETSALEVDKARLGDSNAIVAARMFSLARLSHDLGRKDALPLFEKSLAINEKVLGAEPISIAASLRQIAALYVSEDKHEQALRLYRRALDLSEKQLGKSHPSVAQSVHEIGRIFVAQHKYEEAQPLFDRALEIREQHFGYTNPALAQLLQELGAVHQAQNKYVQATLLYERALRIAEEVYGESHPAVAISLHGLAGVYQSQGKYDDALPLYERALAINEKEVGMDHPLYAGALVGIAAVYQVRDKHREAVPLLERAKVIQERLMPDTIELASTMGHLADAYQAIGRSEDALTHYQKALDIRDADFAHVKASIAATSKSKDKESALKPDPISTAIAHAMGMIYQQLENYGKARDMYERALKTSEEIFGSQSASVASVLQSMGSLFEAEGMLRDAVPVHQKSLKIREGVFGREHVSVGNSFHTIGMLYSRLGDNAKAMENFQQALAIKEKALGRDHPEISATLRAIATIRHREGNSEEALSLCTRSLDIAEKALGPAHPSLLSTYEALAALQQETGNFLAAAQLYERSLQIKEKALRKNDPALVDTLDIVGAMYQTAGKYKEALAAYERSVAIKVATDGETEEVVAMRQGIEWLQHQVKQQES
eukprot:Opistho-1_new@29266